MLRSEKWGIVYCLLWLPPSCDVVTLWVAATATKPEIRSALCTVWPGRKRPEQSASRPTRTCFLLPLNWRTWHSRQNDLVRFYLFLTCDLLIVTAHLFLAPLRNSFCSICSLGPTTNCIDAYYSRYVTKTYTRLRTHQFFYDRHVRPSYAYYIIYPLIYSGGASSIISLSYLIL